MKLASFSCAIAFIGWVMAACGDSPSLGSGDGGTGGSSGSGSSSGQNASSGSNSGSSSSSGSSSGLDASSNSGLSSGTSTGSSSGSSSGLAQGDGGCGSDACESCLVTSCSGPLTTCEADTVCYGALQALWSCRCAPTCTAQSCDSDCASSFYGVSGTVGHSVDVVRTGVQRVLVPLSASSMTMALRGSPACQGGERIRTAASARATGTRACQVGST